MHWLVHHPANVRFGSKAAAAALTGGVRFAPKSCREDGRRSIASYVISSDGWPERTPHEFEHHLNLLLLITRATCES